MINNNYMRKYIALYSRHEIMDYNTFPTRQQAIDFLDTGSDTGELLPIAIIIAEYEVLTYYDEYLGTQECGERVNEFFLLHI